MHYKLALIGFGNVARSLAKLLVRKQGLLKSKYDVTFSFTGLSTGRHGFAVNPDGLDIQKALELVESGQSISALSTFQPLEDSMEVIHHSSKPMSCSRIPPSTPKRDSPHSTTSAPR